MIWFYFRDKDGCQGLEKSLSLMRGVFDVREDEGQLVIYICVREIVEMWFER